MGTNIYAHRIPTKTELQSISEMVLEGNIWAAKQQINQYEKIHIGKRSAGWKFLFNHNNWEHYRNIEEMKEWLRNYVIETEYGEELTWDQFWQEVELRQQTQKAHTEGFNPSWYIVKEGYEFSTSTEFS